MRATSSPSPACPRAPSPTPSATRRSPRRCRRSRSTRRPSPCPSSSTTARSPAPKATRSPAASSATACSSEAEGNVALKIEERRRQGLVLRLRPRRTAARRPDRDHAPRRLRARRVASARRHAQGRGPASRWSRSRKSSSTSTRNIPASSCRRCRSARPRWSSCAPPAATACACVFYAPTRGLIGYQSELLTDTRGTAIMNRLFHAYQPFKGEIAGRTNGVLLSNAAGRGRRLCACSTWKTAAR